MTEYDKLANALDYHPTLLAIADLREEEGKLKEAFCWRLLAKHRRYPCLSHGKGVKWRWFCTRTRRSNDGLPDIMSLRMAGKSPRTVRGAYEKAVAAMMHFPEDQLVLEFSRFRGE